jgi:hypothetical protein
MDPRPGVKYSTTYYKQSADEYKRLQNHIEDTVRQIEHHARESGIFDQLKEPVKSFRKESKEGYTTWEIVTDLRDQLRAGKDLPSGMLGRWNRLFDENPEIQITLEPERNTTNQANLFCQ